MRGIVLTMVGFLGGYGGAHAQSYDALAAKFRASYFMVRTSDYLLDRCSSVPAGDDVVITKGKKVKVTWDGVDTSRRWRETCQGVADGTKREIGEAYPTKVSELERELEEEAPEIEADVRAIAERATKDMREDKRAICYILSGGLIYAAEKNCKP